MSSKRNKQKTASGALAASSSGSGSGVLTVSRRTMEDALLLAHMRCDANCSAATSVAHAINRFWSGLGLDARRALTSEKKHVVLQSLRKKHLHTRNCPCCQHSKVRTHLHPRPHHGHRPLQQHVWSNCQYISSFLMILASMGSFSWFYRSILFFQRTTTQTTQTQVFFDGGARTYERFCTAWENQPDDAGLIDIHSPAILGVDENTGALPCPSPTALTQN